MTAHKRPDIVTELAVPFRPAAEVRESPHLVKSCGVPGLCNQLGVGQNRVSGNPFQQGRIGQHFAIDTAAENRSQVKTEAVDMHFGDPVAQGIDNQVTYHRVIAVDRVAAS